MKNRAVTAVLVGLVLLAIGAATFSAHRARENARAMRASVAKLGFDELLRRHHACELGYTATQSSLDPAYCQEVTRAVASQPLQLVEIPPPTNVIPISDPQPRTDYEHDPRAIEWPGKTSP